MLDTNCELKYPTVNILSKTTKAGAENKTNIPIIAKVKTVIPIKVISDNKVDLQLDANLITPSKNEVAKNALAKLPKNAEGVPEMIASRLLKEFPQPRN